MAQQVGAYQSLLQVQNEYLSGTTKHSENAGAVSFQDILKHKVTDAGSTSQSILKFSKHANERLADRNITLTTEQVARLQDGVLKAREKGIQESLVMLDNLSFIVNVKNDTVVTALDNQSGSQKIFTNIDGAVIV